MYEGQISQKLCEINRYPLSQRGKLYEGYKTHFSQVDQHRRAVGFGWSGSHGRGDSCAGQVSDDAGND